MNTKFKRQQKTLNEEEIMEREDETIGKKVETLQNNENEDENHSPKCKKSKLDKTVYFGITVNDYVIVKYQSKKYPGIVKNISNDEYEISASGNGQAIRIKFGTRKKNFEENS